MQNGGDEYTVNDSDEFTQFVTVHGLQLKSSGIPDIFWATLHHKLKNEIFDAGNIFKILQVEYEKEEENKEQPRWIVVVNNEDGIKENDPKQIYLIDHAWTYPLPSARTSLQQTPALVQRMAQLMEIPDSSEDVIECILTEMWKYNQTYNFGNPELSSEERLPVWYVMDEFGSRIEHSLSPSTRVLPFYYYPLQIAFSILFPIRDLEAGDRISRNYVEGPKQNSEEIRAYLIPWKFADFTHISYEQHEPPKDFFTVSRKNENLPDLEMLTSSPELPTDEPIKVYADYSFIRDYLTHQQFQITDSEENANILCLDTHFKKYKEFSRNHPNKMINQFPFEHVITVKDLLCVVCRRKHPNPVWLPVTFNLETELLQFVSYFQQREKLGLDNHWICKPWNLARGMDTHITSNLNQIVRLPFSGPKVVQKYLEDPVLFHRPEIGEVKFDIRYIILLRRVEPLEVFAYKRFWLRFANKPFELIELDDYERHYTVMNYGDSELKQMYSNDFIAEFETQYPAVSWEEIEKNIFIMFRELFECATSLPPPQGLGTSPQSRAIYAIDLMLDWNRTSEGKTIQPRLLEVNWGPDCERACQYYPEFFNDVFSLLFLEDDENTHVQKL